MGATSLLNVGIAVEGVSTSAALAAHVTATTPTIVTAAMRDCRSWSRRVSHVMVESQP
jgi:urease accessory protein UreF